MSDNGHGDLPVQAGYEAWEKLPKESWKAFEAFALYRDLGVTRSIAKVAKLLGKSESLLGRWSANHRWGDRVSAYETRLARMRLDADESEVEQMRRRELAMSGLAAAIAMRRLSGDSERPDVTPLHPNQLEPGDVARFMETSVRIGRLATGQPTDVIKGGLAIAPVEAQRIVRAIVDLALNRLPPGEHEAFIREVEQLGGT